MTFIGNPLEVKTSKLPFILTVFLGLFFLPLGFGNIYSAITRNFAGVPLIIGVICILMFGVVFWLVFRGFLKSVKNFTNEGLIRNDRKSFLWQDLQFIVNQIHYNPRLGGYFIWRIEIHFKNDGAAWLIPSKISNFQEVRRYIDHLPCEKLEKKV